MGLETNRRFILMVGKPNLWFANGRLVSRPIKAAAADMFLDQSTFHLDGCVGPTPCKSKVKKINWLQKEQNLYKTGKIESLRPSVRLMEKRRTLV